MSSLPPGPPPSSPPPAGPPPSGPPPSGPPPAGPPPGAETLERGGGGRIPPSDAPRTSGGGRGRRILLLGGALIGLGAVGGAAFGAWWYLSTGAQPAEALPAETLGYVAVDLDPSGSQKVDALRTLKKFPAIDDELDLSGDLGDIDVKRVLVEAILDEVPCELDYDDDVESWLGSRGAIAALDLGEDEPSPVFVLQATDSDRAVDGLRDLIGCEGGEGDQPGVEAVGDEWVVLAETPEIVAEVVDATEQGTLADDETFQEWTEAAGDPGIVSMYAAPAAGKFLADNLDGLMGLGLDGMDSGLDSGIDSEVSCEATVPVFPEGMELSPTDEELLAELQELDDLTCATQESNPLVPSEMEGMTEELASTLEDFEGAAVSVRFDGGSIEVEMAGDPGMYGESAYAGDAGADALGSLPGDTMAAFGIGLEDGWFDDALTSIAASLGEDAETLIEEMEEATGLSMPDDAETLLGDSAALSVGGDLDPDDLGGMAGLAGLPVALKVLGDPDGVEGVLDRIRPQLGDDGELLGSRTEDGATVIGPDEGYLEEVLGDGDLGESDSFESVVPDGDDVAAVLYVDLGRIVELLDEGIGFGDSFAVNLAPLDALGMSAWEDDGVSHARLRLSTD